MILRKLFALHPFRRAKAPDTTSLRDWLLGAGVAVACLAPAGAASSLSGGYPPCCDGAAVQPCLDGNGQLCPWYDFQGGYMTDACVVSFNTEGPGRCLHGTRALCPTGCNAAGSNGDDCSVNSSCYY
jgi:hypothetical protein